VGGNEEMLVVKLLVLVPFLILSGQAYNYAVTKKGEERKQTCRSLGVASATIGIVILVYSNQLLSFPGLFLIMMGLRLISHGFYRIEKEVFINKCEEER
jgi:hypothetical protein